MKQTKTKVKKRLDKLWSKIIRSKGYCEVCGKREYLNAHHIIGRRAMNTRYDLRNGCCLCSGCHTFGNKSAHQNPLWFDEWLRNNRNSDYKHLKEKQWKMKQYTLDELLLLEVALKEKLKEIK